jgi:2,3-bisphosphoglycerate-independent phosphoglycerate mutase
MSQKHILYILLDGLGDLPVASLNGMTPLEAANHPFMNKIARSGRSGLVYTVGKGIAPESDVAVISMLGYDPVKTYTGRGPIEAFGTGMKMEDGDLALRCNFATIDDELNIVDRRCGRTLTTEEAADLAKTVNSGVELKTHKATFEFRSTVGHRAVLLIKSMEGPLSGNISNTDPAYQKMDGLGLALKEFPNQVVRCTPLDSTPEARLAADLLQEFTEKSSKLLRSHPINIARTSKGMPPANAILCRDAGSRLPNFEPILKKFGIEFASMVEMPVERGIALLCGMDMVELPKPTGDLAVDYGRRAEMASELIQVYGGVYIHIKGPDEPAHDGDCEGKKRSIELIDAHFFGHLRLNPKDVVVVVTADHSTPCGMKAHSDDPVPLMVAGPGIDPDGTSEFGERFCRGGSLGIMNGQEVLKRVMSF